MQAILNRFAAYPDGAWLLLLDPVRLGDGAAWLERHGEAFEYGCLLYRQEEDVEAVAPHLALIRDRAAAAEAIGAVWSRQAIVLAHSPTLVELAPAQRYFRKFNVVYLPAGQPAFFRYYDPRVLPHLIENLAPAQLERLYEQIDCYLVPGKGGRGGKLYARAAGGPSCTELDIR